MNCWSVLDELTEGTILCYKLLMGFRWIVCRSDFSYTFYEFSIANAKNFQENGLLS